MISDTLDSAARRASLESSGLESMMQTTIYDYPVRLSLSDPNRVKTKFGFVIENSSKTETFEEKNYRSFGDAYRDARLFIAEIKQFGLDS